MTDNSYTHYIQDLLASFGEIKTRAMFGGHGVYMNGLIMAIVADNELYVKADALSRPFYEAAGSEPFTYENKGKTVAMSYWKVPPEILEDQKALAEWVSVAYNSAVRNQKGPKT